MRTLMAFSILFFYGMAHASDCPPLAISTYLFPKPAVDVTVSPEEIPKLKITLKKSGFGLVDYRKHWLEVTFEGRLVANFGLDETFAYSIDSSVFEVLASPVRAETKRSLITLFYLAWQAEINRAYLAGVPLILHLAKYNPMKPQQFITSEVSKAWTVSDPKDLDVAYQRSDERSSSEMFYALWTYKGFLVAVENFHWYQGPRLDDARNAIAFYVSEGVPLPLTFTDHLIEQLGSVQRATNPRLSGIRWPKPQ